MGRRFRLLFLAAMLLCGRIAVGQPAASPVCINLSLTDAIKLAQQTNPVTREASARVAGATARWNASGALPNPTASLADWTGSNTGGLDENILLSQTIELGDKRRQKIKSAHWLREASIADSAQTAQDLTLSVQTAYFDALQADAIYQVSADQLAIVKKFGEAAQVQYSAGDVPRSNVLRSQIDISRTEQELTAAEKDRQDSYSTLRSLIGVPESQALALTDKLCFTSEHYQLGDLQALALKQRPDVISARQTRASVEASYHLAKVAAQPDLLIEARRASYDPNTPGSSLRAGVTWPLLDLGSIRGDIASAKASLAEQDAKLADTERTAKLDVENALHALDQLRSVVESFEGGRIARAKELLDMVQTGYDKGASSYLDLLDAQREYRNEQADYARALAAYNTALATLQRAVGGKLQ